MLTAETVPVSRVRQLLIQAAERLPPAIWQARPYLQDHAAIFGALS